MIKDNYHITIILSVILITISACGTPKVVKNLSSEHLRVQGELNTQLKGYFTSFEEFVKARVEASERRIENLHKKILTNFEKIAEEKLKAQDPNALKELIQNTKSESFKLGELKSQLQQRLKTVKDNNAEFTKAYDILIEAQRTLDTYIQLEKADEHLKNQIIGSLGLTSDRFSSFSNKFNSSLNKLGELIK